MFYNHQVVRNMVITRAYREVSSPRSLHDQQHSLIIQDSFDAVISHQSFSVISRASARSASVNSVPPHPPGSLSETWMDRMGSYGYQREKKILV